jgi:hypothetical protein
MTDVSQGIGWWQAPDGKFDTEALAAAKAAL